MVVLPSAAPPAPHPRADARLSFYVILFVRQLFTRTDEHYERCHTGGSLLALLVQCFSCYRIFVIRRSTWPIGVLIALMSLAQCASGLERDICPTAAIRSHTTHIFFGVWPIGAAAADVVIAVTMTILVRSPAPRRLSSYWPTELANATAASAKSADTSRDVLLRTFDGAADGLAQDAAVRADGRANEEGLSNWFVNFMNWGWQPPAQIQPRTASTLISC
ncbi:hypothetical protein B0H15DRAFT_1021577 [Mycena belliarum]|uniref:Uncharacterized protein n=1 Tax=Mycena belliarum TaxID=1033014 RepID=A0AAD6XRS9_9AGAR|nr:hypothetical protein B0H15DRAFT_1021577 [Mycena belliae]